MELASDRRINTLSKLIEFMENTPKLSDEYLMRGKKLYELFLRDVPFLIISLMGGTGVGKSQMVNAFVGEEVSPSSSLRAFTSCKIFYIHTAYGEVLKHLKVFEEGDKLILHNSDAFKEVVLVDLPDFDGYVAKHREQVDLMVKHTDITVWVIDYNKYNDASIHREYLQPLSVHQDSFVFTLNKIDELLKYGGRDAERELHEIADDFVDTLREKDGITVSVNDIFKVSAMNAFINKETPSSNIPDGEWNKLESLVFDSKRLKVKKYNKHVKEAEALTTKILENFQPLTPEKISESLQYTKEFLPDFISDSKPIILSVQNMEKLSLHFFDFVKKLYSKQAFALFFEHISVSWLKTVFNFGDNNIDLLTGGETQEQDTYERSFDELCVDDAALASFLDIRKRWFNTGITEESTSSIFSSVQGDLVVFLSDYWNNLSEEALNWGSYKWKQWLFPGVTSLFLVVHIFNLLKVGGGMMIPNVIQNIIFYIPLSYVGGVFFFRRKIRIRLALWRKSLETKFEESVQNSFIEYTKAEMEREKVKLDNIIKFLNDTLKNFK